MGQRLKISEGILWLKMVDSIDILVQVFSILIASKKIPSWTLQSFYRSYSSLNNTKHKFWYILKPL